MERPIAHRVLLLFGHATIITLLVLAWKHADIRTTSGDSAYQIFKWVNNPGLNVEAHRFSAIFPQLAVKVFKLFHADLRTLLLVASVAHVLVAYAVFLVALYWIKSPRAAMGAALAAVLCTRLTFYGPVLEANYLLSYPFLFLAVLERIGHAHSGTKWIVILLAAMALTLLVHPLGWLVMLFGTVYLWVLKQIGPKTALVVSLAVMAGAGSVRYLFPPTAYEQAQYGRLNDALSGHMKSGEWASWDFLVGHTFNYTTNYLPALVLLMIVCAGLLVRKKWPATAILVGGVLGYLGLAMVTFRAGDDAMMMDRAFLPIAFLIAVPSIWLFWELKGRQKIVGTVILALVLFIKLRDVSFGSREPRRQLERTESLLVEVEQQAIRKAMVSETELVARKIRMNWAIPFSTLLISSRKGSSHSSCVRARRDGPALEHGGRRSGTPLQEIEIPIKLNELYFKLPEGPYVEYPSTTGTN